MRIWTLHPCYLDAKGLVALWRETLLAKHVLSKRTKGYKNHPQLDRFKAHKMPLNAINFYLYEVYEEALRRGYNFDMSKIDLDGEIQISKIETSDKQLEYEFNFLQAKLKLRDTVKFKRNLDTFQAQKEIKSAEIFEIVSGEIEPWERVKI